jgi:2-oxoglutarate/2-oxoacid ferredoxin oxidoreductase subunit alpha
MWSSIASMAAGWSPAGRYSALSYVVRFAGDSGDGIQLQGLQFTVASALGGNDLATLPDFPAEIRAPAGTRYGVSAFQIQFGGERITTPGDPRRADRLQPGGPGGQPGRAHPRRADPGRRAGVHRAALKRADLRTSNPLDDGSPGPFEVVRVDVSRLTQEAVKPFGMGAKDSLRCKNFWALGLILWMFDQPREPTVAWITAKFRDEALRAANLAALNAGHAYGETAELAHVLVQRPTPAGPLAAAEYRTLTGAEALALGLVAAG